MIHSTVTMQDAYDTFEKYFICP